MAANDPKYKKLNQLLHQTSLYSEFLINKVPEKLRKQLNNTADKVSASFETNKTKDAKKKRDVKNHPLQKIVSGGTLRDYQIQGVEWIDALYQNGLNGILADEMGLGKTIQVITFIGHLRAKRVFGPIMIVAPLSTLRNWVKEFKKWVPDCPVCYYHGTKQERAEIVKKEFKKQKDPSFPVVVTSFEIAILDKKPLGKYHWIELIVDEGHRLKNMECKLIQTLRAYDSGNRLLLTGTPLQNNLRELWSLLNFLLPTIFDNLGSFENWFNFNEKTIEDEEGRADLIQNEANNQVLSKLHEILRPFVLRRLKIHVLDKLPEKKEIVLYPPLTEMQRVYYKSIVEKKTKEVLGIKVSTLQNSLMQLRKVCNHPYLVYEPGNDGTGELTTDESIVDNCAKMRLLDRMLKRLLKEKHKVLIFSQMTRMLDILQDYCKMRGWRVCRIDGGMSADERQDNMDRFQTSKRHNIFLLSTRAGGLGVNLTAADTCVIYDSDWNPHQDSQAQDRCHRFGQKNKVMVYRFITPNSVESQLLKRASSKRKLEKLVITQGRFNKRQRSESKPQAKVSLNDLKTIFESNEGDLHHELGQEISDKDIETLLDRDAAVPDEGTGFRVCSGHAGYLGFLMGTKS